MCGIAAIIGNKNNKDSLLIDMLDQIRHRGESKHFGELENLIFCSLGMNRLAIVDREHAKQPICDSSKRYWIVLNGEIYNYKDLKKQLELKGYVFITDSDTEVLLYGFIEWKEKIVDFINGMYAFFVFDTVSNNFFVARDSFGVKPLYYSIDSDGNYYFASEIKCLSHLDGLDIIENFPAGSYMYNREIHKFLELPSMDLSITESEAIENIRMLVDESVRLRVQTDFSIAVYLSGGVDSTAVLATALKYHNDITAIIAGNRESSDRQFAERYCKENNVKYIIIEPPKEEEIVKNIDNIIQITESFEPNMIRQSSIAYFFAEAAKDFKIILCGEGADEIFAGYPEFVAMDKKYIDDKIRKFLGDLHRTQLQRVDRTSMYWTTEVREPLLDKELVKYVLQIPSSLKIKEVAGSIVTKYIFRKAMEDRLPEYIYNRPKVVLSEGAGYKGNQKVGGLFYDIVSSKVSDEEFSYYKSTFSDRNLQTKEEVFYFKAFMKYNYHKAIFNKVRTTNNKVDSSNTTNILIQNIFDSFNTWKFKREQPGNETLLFELIRNSVQDNQPIKFVMYRGKGKRNTINNNELIALNFLKTFLSNIDKVYSIGTKLHIIYTDTHVKLNEFDELGSQTYKSSLFQKLEEYGFSYSLMSDICPLISLSLTPISPYYLDQLVSSASKHYQGIQPIEMIASYYYQQNQLEKVKVEENYKDHIFLTYNGSNMNFLFSEKMAIFYMYSAKKGDSEKPWFK